jgi:hypothetical protein
MARPKLALRSRSDTDLVTYSENILRQLVTGGEFPDMQPDLPTVEASVTGYRDSLHDIRMAIIALRTAVARKRQQRRQLETILTQVASYVTAATAGSRIKLQSIGVGIIDRGGPVGFLPEPGDLRASAGPSEGQIVLRWKAMRRARVFEIQSKPAGPGDDWTQQPFATRSRATLHGLPPGQRFTFRVRALATAGPSPWSDPAFCRIP